MYSTSGSFGETFSQFALVIPVRSSVVMSRFETSSTRLMSQVVEDVRVEEQSLLPEAVASGKSRIPFFTPSVSAIKQFLHNQYNFLATNSSELQNKTFINPKLYFIMTTFF